MICPVSNWRRAITLATAVFFRLRLTHFLFASSSYPLRFPMKGDRFLPVFKYQITVLFLSE